MSLVKNNKKILFIFIFSWLIAIPVVSAQEGIGEFTTVQGNVNVLRSGKLPAETVKTGDKVFEHDIVRTKTNSSAEISLFDGITFFIAERTRIDISEYKEGDSTTVKLPRGKIRSKVEPAPVRQITFPKERKRLEIHTPNAVAGVRGTDFLVAFHSYTTRIFVNEGAVYAYNPVVADTVISLPAGTTTKVSHKSAPLAPRPATDAEIKNYKKETSAKEGKPDSKSEPGVSSSKPGIPTSIDINIQEPDPFIETDTITPEQETIIEPEIIIEQPPITETLVTPVQINLDFQ